MFSKVFSSVLGVFSSLGGLMFSWSSAHIDGLYGSFMMLPRSQVIFWLSSEVISGGFCPLLKSIRLGDYPTDLPSTKKLGSPDCDLWP